MLGRQAPPEDDAYHQTWDSSDDFDFCDCPGPPQPPKFVIPPPPPSPSSPLCQGAQHHADGQEEPLIQFCSMEPVGAEYTQAAFPSLPIIAVCSSIVLVAVLVATFLLWKHKRKVQNFLPSKSQGRCDMPVGSTAGITYDDVLINHHPTRLPNHQPPPHLTTDTLTPIELLDVKYGNYIQRHPDSLNRTNYIISPSNNKDQRPIVGCNPTEGQPRNHNSSNHQRRNHKKKDRFHPIYEEVSAASDDKTLPIGSTGHSYDSDIEDSEVEGRTVASEDEFAEDELSVAGEYRPSKEEEVPSLDASTTSSLRGSTGGDVFPQESGTGSNERFCVDLETRTLKNPFRGLELSGAALKKHTHSLERNKDGHHSSSFQAKQNYYLNKSMLGPDFTFPEGERDSIQPSDAQPQVDFYPVARNLGSSMNFIPLVLQQRGSASASRSASNSPPPPPYAACAHPVRGSQSSSNKEVISALYNPHVVSPTMTARLPESILRELSYKMPGHAGVPVVTTGAMSSRSLPVPPSCRAGGTGMLFTLDNLYPPPMPAPMSRARSGSGSEFNNQSYHQQQQQHLLSGGRPPTPPPPENIYASIEDSTEGGGPFTIDGSRHRMSSFLPGRKGSTEYRNTFGRNRPLNVAGNDRHQDSESGSYGDIRSNYESRTACS